MKRLGIYLVYDDQGIVDRYIGHFLKELRPCVSTLAVVCNMETIVRGEDILRQYADHIFLRKNIGFDAGGFKDALCSFLGWEKVREYDELVLANDSTIGPFYPMRDIFSKMDGRPLDFWGLTIHDEKLHESGFYAARHVQSFFIAVRSRMLHSAEFQDFWESMPYYSSFNSVIEEYELRFTQRFADLGYTYGSLADTAANDSEDPRGNFNQYALIPYELTKKRDFPFFKKAPIMYDLWADQSQQEFRQLVDYIDRETDYDVDLFWENAIRRFNAADLYRIFHFRYILPPFRRALSSRTAVVVFVSCAGSFELVSPYLEGLRTSCRVAVCAGEEDLLNEYRASGYECAVLSPGDRPAFLAGYADYDFVCVIHAADLAPGAQATSIGKSHFYGIWENLLKSPEHAAAVEELFDREPRLGVLAGPSILFGPYFGGLGKGWDGRYGPVCRAAEKMDLHCRLAEDKPPYQTAENVWVRGSVLAKLSRMDPEDAPLLPDLWSYLAQDAGYYSGVVESPEFASMNEANLQWYLDRTARCVRAQYGAFETFPDMQMLLFLNSLRAFSTDHAPVYIYGVGLVAKYYEPHIPRKDGFIVSDGQPKPEEFCGYPVQYLSELQLPEGGGIILCLNEKNQREVLPLLKERGIDEIFCV
jgi:rhamnosyltransferase